MGSVQTIHYRIRGWAGGSLISPQYPSHWDMAEVYNSFERNAIPSVMEKTDYTCY